jgi:D-alanine--poly(phosphoribitol) ligase subunit 1
MRFELSSSSFVETGLHPERAAVVGADRTLSWEQFRREVGRWVAEAKGLGVGADVPVVIYGHKEAEFLVAMAGCLSLQAPFVPVDTIYPEERMQRIASIVQAPVIYRTDGAGFRRLGLQPEPMQQRGLAYVMFTSGSTGEPKGVQIGREGVQGLIDWMRDCFQMGEAPVYMNQAPFSFDLSIYEVFAFLGIGGTIVLNSREQTADPAAYLARLARERISTWISTPSFARQQLLSKEFNGTHLPDLKTFLFCGEVLPHSLVKRLRERFPAAQVLNTYGPTEATVATTWVIIDDDILARFDPLPVGKAKPDSVVRVAEGGEIEILGPHVMRGYLNRPELNAEKLFEEAAQRGFRSGDLGEMGEDGLLFCRGRRDEQIKLNGFRIELQEIDKALQKLPGVSGSAVVPLRRPDGAVARLVAYVIIPGVGQAVSDWKERLAATLPPYMLPSELLLAETLPVSTNGKIDRKALEQAYLAGSR